MMQSNHRKPVCIGIVGMGFGQQGHLPAFRADPRCEVVAICASTNERAASFAKRHAIDRSYGNWRDLAADPDVDAISIATPPGLQTDIALAALANGKAVLCEKPLALSYSAGLAMVAAAERAHVANMIDFEYPEVDLWRKAKSVLDSKGIGNLRHVQIAWNTETYVNKTRLESWKIYREQGGGALNLFGSHAFHYLEWLLGQRIMRLSCRLARQPGDTRTSDTLAAITVEFESGLVGTLAISSDAFLGNGHRLEFYGDHGALALDNRTPDYLDGFQLFYGTRESNRLEPFSPAGQSDQDGRVVTVGRIVHRFVDWIATGAPSAPSFRDGLRVQRLLDAARQSDQAGCWVSIAD